MNRQKGFSLVELLIVVAIILIIAAIALPNLIRSRMVANETSAVASTRTVVMAETIYASTHPEIGFVSLSALGSSGMIDNVLASGTKSGYSIHTELLTAGSMNNGFAVMADPTNAGISGIRHFCASEDAVLKWDPATAFGSRDECVASTRLVQ